MTFSRDWLLKWIRHFMGVENSSNRKMSTKDPNERMSLLPGFAKPIKTMLENHRCFNCYCLTKISVMRCTFYSSRFTLKLAINNITVNSPLSPSLALALSLSLSLALSLSRTLALSLSHALAQWHSNTQWGNHFMFFDDAHRLGLRLDLEDHDAPISFSAIFRRRFPGCGRCPGRDGGKTCQT